MIRQGDPADLVLVHGNPLSDPERSGGCGRSFKAGSGSPSSAHATRRLTTFSEASGDNENTLGVSAVSPQERAGCLNYGRGLFHGGGGGGGRERPRGPDSFTQP